MLKILLDKLFGSKEQTYLNQQMKLTKSLEKNIGYFEAIFNHDQTVKFHKFLREDEQMIRGCIIFIDGMVDHNLINMNILKPILESSTDPKYAQLKGMEFWKQKVLISGSIKEVADVNTIINSIIAGGTVVLIDGQTEALMLDTKGWEAREIKEPEAEKVVRGPREGFTESLLVNLSLIRRRIQSPKLKFEFDELGRWTNTKVCVCYIQGIASEKIVQEVHRRLEQIEIDGIVESGYIEELIKDAPLTPFKTIGDTERPDTVVGKLLEGRVAIILEGTPFVLTVPFLFMEYFQSPEDYYHGFMYSSLNRIIRIFGFFFSTSVPALYLAIVTYHHELIPAELLLSISASREGVPFPTLLEALLMGLVFEILREAGVRMPSAIGQTASIVGALVLGEAAVSAKLVSAPMVIVTALTGISSFLIPKMLGGLIIVRLLLFGFSSVLGLYGYFLGMMGFFLHLFSLRSFGVPYMLNLGSFHTQDIKDTAIRAPWWVAFYRPKIVAKKEQIRIESQPLEERR